MITTLPTLLFQIRIFEQKVGNYRTGRYIYKQEGSILQEGLINPELKRNHTFLQFLRGIGRQFVKCPFAYSD